MKTWNDSPQLIWVKLNKKKQWTENTQWMSGLFVSQWLTRNGRAHSYYTMISSSSSQMLWRAGIETELDSHEGSRVWAIGSTEDPSEMFDAVESLAVLSRGSLRSSLLQEKHWSPRLSGQGLYRFGGLLMGLLETRLLVKCWSWEGGLTARK